MPLDGYTPQNAHIRFQLALTVANRNQRSKTTADKHTDSDSSVTETRAETLAVENATIEHLSIPRSAEEDRQVDSEAQQEIGSSQLPLASSTQLTDGTDDPNKTTLVQEVRAPSPILEEEETQLPSSSESETRFVID